MVIILINSVPHSLSLFIYKFKNCLTRNSKLCSKHFFYIKRSFLKEYKNIKQFLWYIYRKQKYL